MTIADITTLAAKVAFLSRPEAYPGDAGPVTVRETRMSWVFLTDRHAYKMKKPLRQDRLDFSSFERRRYFCGEEVRLNRRLARDVYLGTVALARCGDGTLVLGGAGTVVEWLVKMRRLPADATLEALALAGRLTEQAVRSVALRMAALYAAAVPEPVDQDGYRRRFSDSLAVDRRELGRAEYGLPADAVDFAADGMGRFLDLRGAALDARVRQGRIVEGHGDLRPEHVYFAPDLLITDCLEFDRDLRVLDPVDELGYLAMECDRIGATRACGWLLDAYGEATSDRPTPELVAFYAGCRALRRARQAVSHLDDPSCRDREHWRLRGREYLMLAVTAAGRLD